MKSGFSGSGVEFGLFCGGVWVLLWLGSGVRVFLWLGSGVQVLSEVRVLWLGSGVRVFLWLGSGVQVLSEVRVLWFGSRVWVILWLGSAVRVLWLRSGVRILLWLGSGFRVLLWLEFGFSGRSVHCKNKTVDVHQQTLVPWLTILAVVTVTIFFIHHYLLVKFLGEVHYNCALGPCSM